MHNYQFSEALPAEVGYLSGITSAIQTQLGTCMKLGFAHTTKINITLTPSKFMFSGAFPTKIGY